MIWAQAAQYRAERAAHRRLRWSHVWHGTFQLPTVWNITAGLKGDGNKHKGSPPCSACSPHVSPYKPHQQGFRTPLSAGVTEAPKCPLKVTQLGEMKQGFPPSSVFAVYARFQAEVSIRMTTGPFRAPPQAPGLDPDQRKGTVQLARTQFMNGIQKVATPAAGRELLWTPLSTASAARQGLGPCSAHSRDALSHCGGCA